MACSGRESFLAVAFDEPCSSHSKLMNGTLGVIASLFWSTMSKVCLQSYAYTSFGNYRNLRFCLQSGLFEPGIFSAVLPFLFFWFQQVCLFGLDRVRQMSRWSPCEDKAQVDLFFSRTQSLKLWSCLITWYIKEDRGDSLVKSVHFYSFSR